MGFIRLGAGAAVLLCAQSISGAPAVQAGSVSALDGRGRRITLSQPPQRIVSLTPSNTEILFDLGLKGRIAADTSQCNFPPEAAKLPHIGDYRISVEQVIAQRPDLVVAVTSANASAIDQLERLHVRVFAVDPYNIAQLYDSILALGRITATEAKAGEVVARMRSRLERLKAKVQTAKRRPKVLIVVQPQPLMIAGSDNFLDEAVTLAGGTNVGREAGARFPLYSPERVVILAPDAILGRASLATLPGWSNVPAVRNHAIFAPPADTLSRPTPRLIDGIEYIAQKLHPELFGPHAGGARNL